jgi:DNA-directed RNA polymerase subunit RPC12/RpoP
LKNFKFYDIIIIENKKGRKIKMKRPNNENKIAYWKHDFYSSNTWDYNSGGSCISCSECDYDCESYWEKFYRRCPWCGAKIVSKQEYMNAKED